MALTARAKWMASVIADVFEVQEYDAHQVFKDDVSKQMLEDFQKGVGPARIFVYYQTQHKINDSGEIIELGGHLDFFVTDGEKLKLKGKGLYFVRTTPPGRPLNSQNTNDNEVLFGEISEHTVTSLDTVINLIYKPFVASLEKKEWGVCEADQKKEFKSVFDKFASELKEALKSLKDNISLPLFDQRFKDEAERVHTAKNINQDMLNSFERSFKEWSEMISLALKGTEEMKKDERDAGPKQELDYWKQRMRRLTGIKEQLSSKNCRTVRDVLTQASQPGSQNESQGKSRDNICLATSTWRGLELQVTEALNEAKDNVKYLQTLEKFIEPLYEGNPETIKETLPALMNSVKMIHTIARYYSTNERMTGLFVKITNQMINNCKFTILNFRRIRRGETDKKGQPQSDDVLWDHEKYPPEELIPVLQSCIDLNAAYLKQYEFTKERLMNMPKGKQFEFSPNAIFGRFDLFCRRVSKLIELFGTIQQFRTLEQHNLEGIRPILDKFEEAVRHFKKNMHKLLDYTNGTFDRDFVKFNVEVSSVETSLQAYIDKNFENITSIEDSLKLLKKFKAILHRDNLKNGLNSKYHILFHNYGLEIHAIEDQYQKQKSQPHMVRNLPTVSGSITWSRHLFHRISGPMEQFPQDLIKQKESRRFVKMYNKIGYTLFSFEFLWRQKWSHEVEKAKAGLQATLIIRHPENNKLYVNFDSEIMTLIKEAKCLSRIGIDIPESAKIVLLQEEKFKMYNNELQFVLREYDRIVNKIRPNTKSLLVPHLEDLEYKLRPGMVTLTWTSMNIDGYLSHVHLGLAKLEQLIININDIMENRIENNLKSLSKTVLVNLPQDAQTFTLDEFVEMQEEWIREESEKLKSKNYEVEGAVEDLIQTICSYQLDQHVEPISAEEIQKLSKYYNWSMYQALLHATKYSLNQMKERICGRRNMPKQILKPFFEVDVQLEGDTCTLKPTLEEVQSAINRAASHVLKSTKNVQNWNQKDQPEDQREPFYDWIAKDKEIVKVILLLTGSIQGTKNNVNKFLNSFEKYDWLWKKKIDEQLKKFNTTNPQLDNFEEKLVEFTSYQDSVNLILSYHQIGALSLKTDNVKTGLIKWIESWKDAYSKDLHKKAKTMLEDLTDNIKQIKLKIEKPVKDVDSLGNVMHALEEIRKKDSEIEIQFRPVIEMYSLLETYIPEIMEKEEMDPQTILDKDWGQLVNQAVSIRNDLQGQQAGFKRDLLKGVNDLVDDVKDFRKNFEMNGPMVPGIEPKEALNRLRMFSDEYSIRERKYNSYNAGETLFGLPNESYPALEQTQKQIELLDKLYNLYSKVKDTIGKWKDIPWIEIRNNIDAMKDQVETFGKDCTKLPGMLKGWDAYKELKQEIEDMDEILPLVEGLAKHSIRDRHWLEVIELTKEDIPYTSETFTLSQLLSAPLLPVKEDIEDICDQADKQLSLEKKLNEEINAYWEIAELEIKPWKNSDAPACLSGNILDIQERLEEDIMTLNQMNATRQVAPFKSIVQDKMALLSDISDTLEKWLKVQTLWTNLVSVFSSGDIAKNMPLMAKKFKGIDKQWLKIMERAHEQKNVIQCCTNDILLNSLSGLQEGLEVCQKKLEKYLEDKRNIFPRFYFCSDADLLKILSVGSDPNAVQDDFEKLFDAINRVSFNETNRRQIDDIVFIMGDNTEVIILQEGVQAEGAIEDWLCKLEKQMQFSMKVVCNKGAGDCFSLPLKEFIDSTPSQVALLGIQMLWTSKVIECLDKGSKEKIAEFERKKKDINNIMSELTELCLSDLNKLKRMKVETLVTIHVHQRDLFIAIYDLAKKNLIKDTNDFEWTKNTRCATNAEGDVQISITDVDFIYSYEFLGAKERLCITDLTDRCYMTLSQALGMLYGGAPAGPAGTGKTETVKDLGRTLGIFVVVTNCSDEHKFRDMAKIFKGVCQSGLWGCFDEFNRISLATLSVVAAQVESITAAKKANLKFFDFPNEENPIKLIKSCGYFITMNPGYAGRQELPENLKVLFRGVTMMVPDRRIIIMVKLASVGYDTYEALSYKFNTLYKLCEEQLSKQRHYDFGLRNILSVLRTAGNSKRSEPPGTDEELIMARTLRDMNLSKFVAQDIPLFLQLLLDIFPKQGKNIPKKVYKEVEKSVKELMKQNNLVSKDEWVIKIIQLYETSLVRHGFMVVGSAGCGKTTIMNTLTEALSNTPPPVGNQHKLTRMNPKAITGQEMYGVMNTVTGEWVPGVFSEIWKKCNDKKNKHMSWIVCDGPVDAIWIENLNTVLDDNKILTLANADRIPMIENMKMVFEVENLNNASPATVSRCGIIYVSAGDLGWRPLIDTWAKDRQEMREACNPEEGQWIVELTAKYIEKTDLVTTLKKDFNYVMPCPEVIRGNMMLNLLQAVLKTYVENGEIVDKDTFTKYFLYCMSWAWAGLFETEEREKFHKILEGIKPAPPLPTAGGQRMGVDKETIFDYYVDQQTKQWTLWVPEEWTPPKRIAFSQLLIPTSDSTRAEYIIDKVAKLPIFRSEKRKELGHLHTLLVGGPGTAKTSVMLMYTSKFDTDVMLFKRINFSSATTPYNFQESIESELEKKQSKTFVPTGGKKMTVFLDDVSMPFVNTWGDQITLEITRQLIEAKGFYYLTKEERGYFRNIEGLQFLAAMNHPGGGRNDIPHRLKRHFFLINMTPPSQKAIEDIYGRILTILFNPKRYSAEVVAMKTHLIDATISIWDMVKRRLLPTPAKFHYTFTIRELARVFQGICGVAQKYEYKVIEKCSNIKEKIRSELFLIALWRHECDRTFIDKLTNNPDKKIFSDMLDRVTKEKFRDSLGFEDDQLMTNYYFADFQREDVLDEYGDLVEAAPYVYEACPDLEAIRTIVNKKMLSYNEKNPSKQMNLVIFDDALKHLLRITRIVNSPSGNILLVGVGGSGKQSLTKLAAFIAQHNFFQISLTKTYNINNLKEDILELYRQAGPQGKQVSFIMTDAEIKSETFLEAINSMLATGEIPGLIPKDEKDILCLESKTLYVKEMGGQKGVEPSMLDLWIYFINRVKDCLHMVLAFSPVGAKFRERAQKFPSLFSQCSIDWFLPWPEDALVAVSHKFLNEFKLDATEEIKKNLESHMGKVHDLVTEVCEIYFQRMRRHVYVTPKSYLSFIDLYKEVYKKKYDGIDVEESNIVSGLQKLAEASEGVEELKIDLKKEEVKLKEAQEVTSKLLKELEVENKKAKEKADEVAIVAENCISSKNMIMKEKEQADKELQAALPFLRKAEQAVDSIKPADINELKGMRNAVDTTRLILDTIHILFQRSLDPVKAKNMNILKQDIPFVFDSFDNHTKVTLSSQNFLKDLMEFSEIEKDNINEETIELLEPYLKLHTQEDPPRQVFVGEVAKKSSSALQGMCVWAAAMSDYHIQSKIVKPKLRMLEIKMAELKEAEENLAAAEAELAEVTALKERLRKKFDDQMAESNALQERAQKTKKKMDQANRLINSLQDNKDRWIKSANEFKSLKQRLVGDVAKACAFVSYCGPFNSEFRTKLLDEYFHQDIMDKAIPVSEDLQLTQFLVDPATVGEWNMEGLPSDDLSIQNGIMVTRSSRYPLMIDPQSQALTWIKQREPELMEQNTVITLNVPDLKRALQFPVENGYPVLIESIENEVDPMLDPILERQITRKGKKCFIKLADQEMDWDERFRLYMTSRLANPHFSPELAAKATIIDFTVTQGGLEQQLLGRLISKEQKSLEEQLTNLQEEVTSNTKTLASYEEQLLERLANAEGSLLDDVELIDVLATIKAKSKEVNEKLVEASEKKIEINEKREQYRPVAARGAVLYFCIVEMTLINWMYNTSLQQFLGLFDYAIDFSPKAQQQLVKDRVFNIVTWLTRKVYRYINRGIFEKDKITFKLMMATKILIKEGKLTNADVGLLLKAGSGIDDRNKPFNWMQQKQWLNLKALSKHKFNNDHSFFFKELPERVNRNEQLWRKWIDENEPENTPVPDYEEKISSDQNIGHFIHLCLVRAMREDRTLLAASQFIREVLGDEFVAPVTDQISEIFEESLPRVPVLYLLSAGADPTGSIDEFAKKKRKYPTGKVSMGEEMEGPAKQLIDAGFVTGKWVVLNNCHLSLELMAEMEDILNPKDKEIHEDFRLWITCSPHNEFPLGLLQMALKVTTEPPMGIQAGLSRTFNTMINQDFLEKVEPYDKWRSLVFSVCFMHSIVQERRKFGPLGFCIPYEFNNSDLEASLLYIEKHMNQCATLGIPYSWKAMQYMVCDVQYGGRITDGLDREMFNTYGQMWVSEVVFQPHYCFNSNVTEFNYMIPEAVEHQKFIEYIAEVPGKDTPPIFGLHPNADLTYRLNQSTAMINTLLDTQPKESSGGSGKSREEEVKEKLEKDLLPQLPPDFIMIEVQERLKVLKGPKALPAVNGSYETIPLNIFLFQELQRFQSILNIVRTTMVNMIDAIEGTIIMTPELVDAINAIYDFRVPNKWLYDPTGVEISWLTPSLAGWIKGLLDRHHQLNNWISKERPASFWLTGFFNPQGFLTSMKQEVTRQKQAQGWSLDAVEYITEVQKEVIQGDDGKIEGRNINSPQEGCLIHGLYLEGAGWNRGKYLEESEPKVLFCPFPIMLVSAISTQKDERPGAAKPKVDLDLLKKTHYNCPVYKYPKRNDKYLIFRCFLKADPGTTQPNQNRGVTAPMKWKLSGVALLCTKE